ncbi:hypothetical protein Tco_1439329 [Tanacetum coccineum]
MMVRMLLNATSATKLAIWPVTVGGNFKRECPKLKNNNQGNPTGNDNAPAKVYAVGHAETNPDSNVVMLWKFMAMVVVYGGEWRIKGVFGSLDPRILTTPSSSLMALINAYNEYARSVA